MTLIIISWIATILCIGGNAWVIAKHKNGFLIWFVGTGILLFLAILRKDWSQVVIFTFYEIMNLVGYIKWGNKKGE